jgi:hypothetical protein
MERLRAILASFMGLVAVACGGVTDSVGDAADGSALRTCTIPAGTYTQHFTVGSGGIDCPSIADQTIIVSSDESITGSEITMGGGDFGLADAGGPGCTNGADSSSCTFTTTCTTTASGVTSQVSTSFTFNGDSATGEETLKSTDSTGNVLSSCNYDVAMTKH